MNEYTRCRMHLIYRVDVCNLEEMGVCTSIPLSPFSPPFFRPLSSADMLSMVGNGKDVTLQLSGNKRLRNILWAFRKDLDQKGDEDGPVQIGEIGEDPDQFNVEYVTTPTYTYLPSDYMYWSLISSSLTLTTPPLSRLFFPSAWFITMPFAKDLGSAGTIRSIRVLEAYASDALRFFTSIIDNFQNLQYLQIFIRGMVAAQRKAFAQTQGGGTFSTQSGGMPAGKGLLNRSLSSFFPWPSRLGELTSLVGLTLRATDDEVADTNDGTWPKVSPKVRVPDSIGQLTRLTGLDLSGSDGPELPASLQRLTNLTSLCLVDANLAAIPPWIQHLTKLTFLSLTGNPRLRSIPRWLSRLSQLNSLYIDCTGLWGGSGGGGAGKLNESYARAHFPGLSPSFDRNTFTGLRKTEDGIADRDENETRSGIGSTYEQFYGHAYCKRWFNGSYTPRMSNDRNRALQCARGPFQPWWW